MTKKVLFLWVGLFFLTGGVFSQTPNDTIVPSKYYKKADSLLTHRKYEESIVFFKKALPLYKKANTWVRVASCYNKISENHRLNLNYDESLKAADHALQISEEKIKIPSIYVSKAYFNKGQCFLIKGSFHDAIVYFKDALQVQRSISSAQNPNPILIEILVFLARSYYVLGNYTVSLQYMEKALSEAVVIYGDDHPEIARIYINTGAIHEKNENYNTALQLYNTALEIILKSDDKDSYKSKVRIAAIYHNIGVIHSDKGNYNAGLESFKKGQKINLEVFSEDHPKVLNSYNSIGITYKNKGQYNLALEYLNKASDLLKHSTGNNIFDLTNNYNNISTIYLNKNEYQTALVYLLKAEKIWIQNELTDHPGLLLCYANIAVTLNCLKLHDEAISYLNKALVIAKKRSSKNHKDLGLIYLGFGESYRKKKEFQSALYYLEKSKVHYSEIHNNKRHPDLAKCNNFMGKIYEESGDLLKALEYYQSALKYNNLSHDKESVSKNSEPIDYMNMSVEIASFLDKAIVLKKLYLANKDLNHLKIALSTYISLDKLIDENRHNILTYEDKVAFSELVSEVYENAIETALLLALEEGYEASAKKAFYYLEKKKTHILKEFILKEEIKKHLDIPSDIISLEDKIKADQSYYKSKLIESTNSDSLSIANRTRYKDELFRVNRKHDSLASVLREQYQGYYRLKHQNSIVSIEEVQENLEENSTLIELFATDNTTHAFIISKNGFSIKELATTNTLESNIEKLRNAIISNNINKYQNSAYTLYNELIAPIKDELIGDELIIIPDGPLWHLNFDLLLTQNNEDEARNMSYLLRDYAISYANSANLLFNPLQKTSKSSEIRRECLAFSFSDNPQLANSKTMSLATLRGAGDDLPGTRKEIKSISNIVDGQYFYGSEAIEANFKQNVNQYSILHLALHGDVDHENPQNSKLYFTKSKDTIEDNLLYSHELFALDIPAELAVLSACNTGTGTIAKGEGIMSLGNAFQYAGTKSLLLSSWEVSDKSAPVLIENFYINLANGMNKAKALQKAKLDFLKTASFDQVTPFYWGSFYLLGNVDPIDIDQPIGIYIYWIALTCVLILLFLVFFYYRKKLKG
ncbi:CHAT domain-containing protein [Aquimarina sp. 2304DJ70-9]|uniref:CHAT domain-containing protein n=1 Tax=Aquimarina penaris TaxID=3231044 RepID=UPI003461F22D